MNTIYHHTKIQNQILSTFNDEFKIRPTYSEILDFIAKRSEPEVVNRTYVALELVNNVSNEIERKIEISAGITKDRVDDYKEELEKYKEKTMENFRKLSTNLDKHVEERKATVRFVRN